MSSGVDATTEIWDIDGTKVNVTPGLRLLAHNYVTAFIPSVIRSSETFPAVSPLDRRRTVPNLNRGIFKENPDLRCIEFVQGQGLEEPSVEDRRNNRTVNSLPADERAKRFLIYSKVLVRLIKEEVRTLGLSQSETEKIKASLCEVPQANIDRGFEGLQQRYRSTPGR